ncbi:FHA domain-containing protein [Cryobacterium sp. CG_9.6]|uniref:FHA domain-containing protein n=1 Tax=Cryobacterium sp. CG_9.6 TaxID=2760710 RepID=UPI002476E3FE|nr:FHA domain-containing protein [Cryobacterium sp. CG_9.6]MDH6236471.1 hypothetical protein [Cryobacterium sp. CG_9.6]
MNIGRVGCVLGPGASPEWTFIVGPGLLAAVPVGTPAHLLETLLETLSEWEGLPQPTVDRVAALLPLQGDDAVQSCAIVIVGEPADSDGVSASVLVHGGVAVDVFSTGGSRRITDGGVPPWRSADFVSVTGLAIGIPGTARVSPDELDTGQTVDIGAISGSTLFWSILAPEQAAGAARTPVPKTQPITSAVATDFDDTILRVPHPLDRAPASATLPANDDTILRPVVPDSARIHSSTPFDEAADAPGAPFELYGFRLPDGTERRLDTVYLLGRRPTPPRVGAGRPSRLITLASRTSAVSATHLEIRQDGDAVVVTDVGSTNGTMVFPARGRRQRLRAGQSVAVRPGTRVDIGDGNIIEVLR